MKRNILFLLTFCLLTLAACASSGDTLSGTTAAPAQDGTAAESTAPSDSSAASDLSALVFEEQAVQLTAAMQAGDFSGVYALFDEQMSAGLSEEALKAAWDSTVAPLGAYIGHISSQGLTLDGACTVTVLEKYEQNGLLIQWSFQSSGQIQGLWFTYQDVSGMDVAEPGKEAPTVSSDQPEGDTPPSQVKEEDITILGDPHLPLSGLLTLPEDMEDKPPVVILVQGSGASDRNETLYGNTPFQDIAWGLAVEGIASIRYDKRFYAYPEAITDPAAVTIEDEVLEDVDAAIALAMSDPRLDHDRVYVLGHSLGGMLAPAIADAHPELAGIISMAGSLRPLWEISWDQNRDLADALLPSLSEEEGERLSSQLATVESDVDTLRQLSADGVLSDPDSLPEPLEPDTLLLGIPLTYWSSLERNAGKDIIDHITVPILILQGDADFQVYPDTDYTLWQDTLADRDNVVFHLYEGLNHLMMPTRGFQNTDDYVAKSSVDKQVILDIAEFISGH
ncbi:MAG: alpha/beta fold hydrolase [Lachnospiraceae bacterium]|jgi:dienelactone hydrolase|nr:alpha/beta fold hydrolase [Lachnospiraceae bacterium]